MTLAPESPTQTHDLQVRTDPAGKPLAIRHDGQIWLVDSDAECQHWYAGDSWGGTRRTAAVGNGDLVSIEYWRVQARLGSSTSAQRTFTLRQNPPAAQWLLASISH